VRGDAEAGSLAATQITGRAVPGRSYRLDGWAALNPDGTLEGHIYFHLSDDSAFRAERFNRVIR
jgi:hypothetical protein